MWLFVVACVSAPQIVTPDSTFVNTGADCPERQASFECSEGPTDDVSALWRDEAGYGWPDRAVWSSSSAVNLHVQPVDGYAPGSVDLEVHAAEMSVVRITVSDCDLPYCPWAISEGSTRVTGELRECPVDDADTAGEPCVAGALIFAFTAMTFASGGSTEPMSLTAGFGPYRPGP